MILDDDEKAMRDGAEGPAVAAAMDLLIRYGGALDAERLCDTRNVAGTTTQPSPAKARLVAEGGWNKAFAVINLDCDEPLEIPDMKVPTCQLQHGFGPDSVGTVPYPEEFVELQTDAEAFYGRRGVNILATCTPYQVGNLPVRGEHIAWMESSAVVYANPVIGARTNCEGGVELYHLPGITPEAPTVEAAFGPAPVPEAVHYGPAERRAMYETLNDQGSSTDVDFVLLGCPHASIDQMRAAARALDGKRLHSGTQLWIMAPRALKDVADRSGYTAVIEAAGGKILADSCPAMSRTAPAGTKVFATDSAKQAHYLPAILGIEAWFGKLDDCVDAAVTGRWRGELR
jgi:predicted aconitase